MSRDVSNQPHYAHGIEPIDYMRSRFTAAEFRGFLTGNVLKYVSRFQHKDGIKDLEKARVYLDWLIAAEREHEGLSTEDPRQSFQRAVGEWMQACFGAEVSADLTERNHRFLEEALELAQACGTTEREAQLLVGYVFERPTGEIPQEIGGVQLTLAALGTAHGLDVKQAGEDELARVWQRIPQIQEKQATKPEHSPLPGGDSQ